jgi:transcriptional regulator with PAS, ATPase and Fis domain
VTITLPTLRERREDIPLLAAHFLKKYAPSYKKDIKHISPDAMKIFTTYEWPGNVRELENTIERAVVLEKTKTITTRTLPQQLQIRKWEDLNSGSKSLMASIEKAEAEKIRQVLKQTEWRKAEAAQILGISRKTLWEKIRKYDIQK